MKGKETEKDRERLTLMMDRKEIKGNVIERERLTWRDGEREGKQGKTNAALSLVIASIK